MNLRDLAHRTLWTAIEAAGAGLLAGPLLDVAVWQAAGVAALAGALTVLVVFARQQLARYQHD